jgi:hypothetical protein
MIDFALEAHCVHELFVVVLIQETRCGLEIVLEVAAVLTQVVQETDKLSLIG